MARADPILTIGERQKCVNFSTARKSLSRWVCGRRDLNQSHRRRAGRDIRAIYAAFRRLLPFCAIDEELNLPAGRAEYHAKKLRRLGDRFFSFAPGAAPPRIARGKRLGTKMPPEFREKMSRIRKAYWRRRACPENGRVAAD